MAPTTVPETLVSDSSTKLPLLCTPRGAVGCPGEEETLKFYITSCSFCLCNSACSLQSLDHIGHIVSESGDLQYWELELTSLSLVLLFATAQPLQTCLIMSVQVRQSPPHLDCCSHTRKTP